MGHSILPWQDSLLVRFHHDQTVRKRSFPPPPPPRRLSFTRRKRVSVYRKTRKQMPITLPCKVLMRIKEDKTYKIHSVWHWYKLSQWWPVLFLHFKKRKCATIQPWCKTTGLLGILSLERSWRCNSRTLRSGLA